MVELFDGESELYDRRFSIWGPTSLYDIEAEDAQNTAFLKRNPQLRPDSIDVVRRRMSAFLRISLVDADIDTLRTRIRYIAKGYHYFSFFLPPNFRVFRGTKWSAPPRETSQISYPPVAVLTGFQRASRPGIPMFYSSMSPVGPLFELKLVPGDCVALSHWTFTDRLFVTSVGYIASNLEKASIARHAAWTRPSKLTDNRTNKLIDRFLGENFSRDVPTGSDDLYKVSTAIAEYLYSGIFNSKRLEWKDWNPPTKWDHDSLAGIVYPSLAMRANSDNIVLKPEFVDRHLRVDYVLFIKVLEVWDDKIAFSHIDTSEEISASGDIVWSGEPGPSRIVASHVPHSLVVER